MPHKVPSRVFTVTIHETGKKPNRCPHDFYRLSDARAFGWEVMGIATSRGGRKPENMAFTVTSRTGKEHRFTYAH